MQVSSADAWVIIGRDDCMEHFRYFQEFDNCVSAVYEKACGSDVAKMECEFQKVYFALDIRDCSTITCS